MTMRATNPLPTARRSFALVLGLSATALFAIDPESLRARLERNEALLVVDLRPASAFVEGHVPGAVNIPLGLLPFKPLPASMDVIVYGDGLGLIDDARALAAIRTKPGVRGDVLTGGYAAWLAVTRLTTAPVGVERERLPGITYDQLMKASKSDMVLVDLRGETAAPFAADAPGAPRRERLLEKSTSADLVVEFAAKLGVPLISGPSRTSTTAGSLRSEQASGAPARAAAPAVSEAPEGRLLVLVADNDRTASEVARELRSRGHYRFTILIGGTESIRHEGRVGSARMDSDLVVPRSSSTR